jgi:hypothetical protein
MKTKRKYILKEGIVLRPYGVNSRLDNTNITDAIAKLGIKKGWAKKTDFITQTNKTKENGNNR